MNQNKIDQLLDEALTLHHEGKLERADSIYKKILKTDENNFQANHLHGCVLSQNSNFDEAIIFLIKSVKINPDNYEANNNLGIAYKNTKAFSLAEKHFKKSIEIDKNNYKAYFNCANLYIDNDKYEQAIIYLEKVLKNDTNFAEAPHRLGEVYQYKYQKDRNKKYLIESEKYFKESIKRDSEYVDSYLMLAMNYLWLGNIKMADKYFKTVLKLNISNEEYVNKNIHEFMSDDKSISSLIKHEYEQLTFIDNDTDDIRNPKFTKIYYEQLSQLHEKLKTNSLKHAAVPLNFKKNLFKILYNKAPRISHQNLLNQKNDISSLESTYLESSPELIVIDNFLEESALNDLQKFCRNANIFKQPYNGGYLAAFLSKGLSNEFILKLSEDLRLTYKKIFQELRLTQAWIFKYDSNMEGTKIHADQASINVNFWISPDDANLDRNGGGLKIWDEIPPKNWGFDAYNSLDASSKIKKILDDNNVKPQFVPYKENRAVIFNSKLFHATDNFNFKDSYENRRINVTFLYD